MKPWSRHHLEILTETNVTKDSGLSDKKASDLLKSAGPNLLRTEKQITNLRIFLKQFNNPMVYTLAGATAISLFLGEALDAIAIFMILIINSVIGFIQESKANRAIQALKEMTVPSAHVIRNGKVMTIPSEEVVPGDILKIEAGDFVTADARLLEAFQLTADESPLTGESLPVHKNPEKLPEETILADRKNMIHAGTAISNGSARAVVTSTGMNTEIGSIAGMLEGTKVKETPLQSRLSAVSNRLILFGVVVILIVIVLRYLEGDAWFSILMSAISLAVAAIPEGMPTVVTLALTLAVRRMTKRAAIVRNLNAVETLGSTDVICTDKTGTLTTGVMTVRNIHLQDPEKKELFQKALILCNNASLDHDGSGDTTEIALLKYVVANGVPFRDIKKLHPRIHEWSFDSDRKRMSVAVRDGERTRIFTKGAPETMLDRCELSKEQKNAIFEEVHKLSSRGERILAVAEKNGEIIDSADDVEKGLFFLGLVSMADPPKKETLNSIRECKDAGIKVVMITGDHPVTAKAIASELEIVIPGAFEDVLTGKELESMSLEELRKKVDSTAVYARVSPVHKLRIIEALQANGHVVAMTGDGVNDAPALKKAEIGVAMGKGGTEVARQAASMVLTDDNFSTIVAAIEEGRAIYGNIKRTIQYLLSTNLAEIMIVLGASLAQWPVPFTPIGLLWINLVTDGFPSLALAAEPLDKKILEQVQRPNPTSFFDNRFIRELLFVGILITVISLVVYHYGLRISDELTAHSYVYTVLVYLTLFRSFSCRSETKSYFELPLNFYHLFSVFIPLVLQFFLMKAQTFQELLEIKELSIRENLFLIFLGIVPVTILELHKLWRKK